MRSAESVAAMACPICKTGLQLSVRAEIEIDYCPACRGVWLDRGELDKIIERSNVTPAPTYQSAPPRHDMSRSAPRYDDDDRYKNNKYKKSFLAELFD
jgi:Zn-finger nucleic acid-binding protein